MPAALSAARASSKLAQARPNTSSPASVACFLILSPRLCRPVELSTLKTAFFERHLSLPGRKQERDDCACADTMRSAVRAVGPISNASPEADGLLIDRDEFADEEIDGNGPLF